MEKEFLEKLTKSQAEISENLSKVTGQITFIKEDLSRALGYLENNDRTNTKGLVESYQELEQRVTELEIRGKITRGKIAIVVLLLTSLGGFVTWLLEII